MSEPFVLTITYKYGDLHYVRPTMEECRERLIRYIKNYWAKEVNEPLPEILSREDINRYMDSAREHFSIDQALEG